MALAFVRYARSQLQRLREETSDIELWAWDIWPVDRVDPVGRWAHQPVRRIYFADIEPAWLRELVKRWARWRLSAGTMSPAGIDRTAGAVRRLGRWLDGAGRPSEPCGTDPRRARGFPRRSAHQRGDRRVARHP